MRRLRAKRDDPLKAILTTIDKLPPPHLACKNRRMLYGESFCDNIKFSALYRRQYEFKADYVYHYTSIDAFEKLISDDADLLLTRYDNLNDDLEFELGLRDVFWQLDIEWHINGHKANLLRKKMTKLYSNGVRVPWIMSFSEANDSLYQWAMYTDREKGGCSIAYDFREMNYQVEKLKNKSEHFDIFFLPCLYNYEDRSTVWDLWYSRHKELLEEIMKLDYFEVKARQDELFDPIVDELMLMSAIIKHPSFSSEREWRLIILPKVGDLSTTGISPIELAGKQRLGFNQCLAARIYNHNWIRGVMVSPQNKAGRVARSDRCFDIMHRHGHFEPILGGLGWTTDVASSSVPYNGR